MGSSNAKSQQTDLDKDLWTPILDKIPEPIVDTQSHTNTAKNSAKLNAKNAWQINENKKPGKKGKLDDMIINEKELLPAEFPNIEDLKRVYQTQKEKKKRTANESCEWDLTVFAAAEVTCFTITNDNKYIISGIHRGLITVFDMETKKVLHCFETRSRGRFRCVTVSEDNEYIVATIQRDIKLFNLNTREEVFWMKNVHDSEILSVLMTKNKNYLITGGEDYSIKILDILNQEEICHLAQIHQGGLSVLSFGKFNLEGPIYSLAFSNDNNYFVSASGDGTIKIFDFNEKKEIHHFASAHKGAIYSVTISQDDSYIISGSADHSIKVFSLKKREELFHFEEVHKDEICAVTISKDRLIYSGSKDLSIKILNLEKREIVSELKDTHKKPITSLTISHDQRFLLSGSEESFILIFDRQTQQKSYLEDAHKDKIISVAISNDNRRIISGSKDGDIKVFNLQDKDPVPQVVSCGGRNTLEILIFIDIESVFFLATSSHNKYVVCGCSNSTKLFELQSLKQTHEFPGFSYRVAISSDERFVITTPFNSKVKIFSLRNSQEVREVTFEWKVVSICLSQDMKYLVVGSSLGIIKTVDFLTNQEIFESEYTLGGCACSVIISYDNKYIASGHENDLIRVFNLEAKQPVYDLQVKVIKGQITCLAITKDNMHLVSNYSNGSIKVWHIETKQEVHFYENLHEGKIRGIALSFDDQYIVSGSDDQTIKVMRINRKAHEYIKEEKDYALFDAFQEEGQIKIINLKTKKEEHCLPVVGWEKDFTDICISRDGKFVAATKYQESIMIFNLDKKQAREIINSEAGQSIEISSNNKYLCSGDLDGSIQVYDLQTAAHIFRFKEALKDNILALAISSDSRYLAAGSDDGSIKIFDVETKQEVHYFEKTHNGIKSICFSRDSKFMISTSSYDSLIKVYDIHTKIELQQIESSVAISPDNNYILTRGSVFSIYLSETNQLNHTSSNIPIASLFAGYDDFLTLLWPKDTEVQKTLLLYHKDMYIYPHRWTILHLLAIFNPFEISNIPEYDYYRVPFLIDSYGKTPLHYLLAQKNHDYAIINIMLKYILDYLEDKTTKAHEYQQVCSSLSNCFFFIVSKASPVLIRKYLNLCYPETPTQYDQVLPSYGLSDQKCIYSQIPVINNEVLSQLHQEGDEKIIFHTNMISLDYDPQSNDMFILTHVLSGIKQETIFQLPLIEKLVDYLWLRTNKMMYLAASSFSLLMILLSIYIGSGHQGFHLGISIILLTTIFIISELMQALTLRFDYIKSLWNWVNILQLLLTLVFMINRLDENKEIFYEDWMVLGIITGGYLRWLSYLRLFKPTRVLIRIIQIVICDMLGFIIITASIIVGFSLIFLEFSRNQSNEQEYGFHLYNTFKLLFANYDDADYRLSQTILVSFLLCLLNVVLLNLLIAIIGDSYGKVKEGKEIADAKTRLEMIQGAMIFMRKIGPKRNFKRGYLIYRLPATVDEDTVGNKEWERGINKVEDILKRNKDKEQENIRKEVRSLAGLLEKVKKENTHQVSESIKRIEEQVNQMKNEVKENVNQQISEVRNEVKSMGEKVDKIQDNIQALTELVNRVLVNLNEASNTVKPT